MSNEAAAIETKLHLPGKDALAQLMELSARHHRHLCPRQVLGIRMGLSGLRWLGFIDEDFLPHFQNKKKELLTIVETDGCGADGIAAATNCYVGKRTLRILDFGKMAATLVNTRSGEAVRIAPQADARRLAQEYAPNAQSHWHSYLEGYQIIPDEALLISRSVTLKQSIAEIMSKPTARTKCSNCGEEILNQREIIRENKILCQSCAGNSYYCEI